MNALLAAILRKQGTVLPDVIFSTGCFSGHVIVGFYASNKNLVLQSVLLIFSRVTTAPSASLRKIQRTFFFSHSLHWSESLIPLSKIIYSRVTKESALAPGLLLERDMVATLIMYERVAYICWRVCNAVSRGSSSLSFLKSSSSKLTIHSAALKKWSGWDL